MSACTSGTRTPDDWDVLVELWWGGRLRRWCWNTKGGLRNQVYDFEVPEGRNISFFIAEFEYDRWRRCSPGDDNWDNVPRPCSGASERLEVRFVRPCLGLR